ncbi:MAG: TRAP transporter substrate-binding protein [Rhodospirillaceae bacterium]|nr:TRAP transporter substrate-binding protein [Rhodospirillaceae bacterium]
MATTAPAWAEITLKIGWTTSDGAEDPYAITARQFAQALEELAPGEFEVQYFPNRQLGDEKEMLEGLSFGTLEMGIITNAVIANIDPAFQLNDMPFLFTSEAQAHEVLDGPVGQQLLARLADHGIVGLGFAEGGFRHMINNVRPVSVPADVEGVKYRVMQNPVYVEMFGALGGNAVPMAWGEVFTAVQQGTIDGLEIPVPVIANNQYAEVTHYLSLTRHTYSALGVLMSQQTYDGLTAEQQAAVQEAAHLAITREREINATNIETLLGQLQAAGMEVNEIEDPAAFRGLVTGVYEMFREEIGSDLLDQALAAVQ